MIKKGKYDEMKLWWKNSKNQ